MREKLIELLTDICEKYAPCEMDVVADHLIANGVVISNSENTTIDFDYTAEDV